MSRVVLKIDAISDLALEVMKVILEREAEARQVMGEDGAPLELAAALSEFFQAAAALEADRMRLEPEELNEFGAYGLDLLDRLSFLVRKLELMDARETMSRVFVSLAVWFAGRDTVLDNLDGAADGFGMLVNGTSDSGELAEMCRFMDEVIEAASDELKLDEDRGNAWRPWRVINLNSGIAATRSLDPDLMDRTFEKLGRRLPYDMAGFLADGKRQMMGQNVPDDVRWVMDRYAEKWPGVQAH